MHCGSCGRLTQVVQSNLMYFVSFTFSTLNLSEASAAPLSLAFPSLHQLLVINYITTRCQSLILLLSLTPLITLSSHPSFPPLFILGVCLSPALNFLLSLHSKRLIISALCSGLSPFFKNHYPSFINIVWAYLC